MAIDKIENIKGFVGTKDIGNSRQYHKLLERVKNGEVVRIRAGVYTTLDCIANTMIDLDKIVPNGILCLNSALFHYELTTLIPSSYCVAIERSRKIKTPDFPSVTLYYWKKENLEFGIEERKIFDYQIKITDIERTICDAIKYRNKIGIDIISEVLNNYIKRPNRDLTKLSKYAEKLRVTTTINKYLEVIL